MSGKNSIVVNCDGLCEPRNPGGIATWGWVACRDDSPVDQRHGTWGRGPGATNNVAEYAAVIDALQYLLNHGHAQDRVVIRSDSLLVINQLKGRWKVKSERIGPLYIRAKALAEQFTRLSFAWVPREQNVEADRLSRVAYAEARKNGGAL